MVLQGDMWRAGNDTFLILSAWSAGRNRSILCLPAAVSSYLLRAAKAITVCVFVLHRVIFALGISMTLLNVPVEFLSLGFEWTWMLLFEDVQQGVFYSTLFCFWIIFCGEHLLVSTFSLFPHCTFLNTFSPVMQFCSTTKSLRTKVGGIGSQRTGGRSGWWCSAHLFSSFLTWVKGNNMTALDELHVLL